MVKILIILFIQRAARCFFVLIRMVFPKHAVRFFLKLKEFELFPKCRLARSAFEVGAASDVNLFKSDAAPTSKHGKAAADTV